MIVSILFLIVIKLLGIDFPNSTGLSGFHTYILVQNQRMFFKNFYPSENNDGIGIIGTDTKRK